MVLKYRNNENINSQNLTILKIHLINNINLYFLFNVTNNVLY